MLKNIVKFIYLFAIIGFLYFVLTTYFSEKNKLDVGKSVINEKNSYKKQLPIIKNDTNDVIIFNYDNNIKTKIKKRKVWELLKWWEENL